MPYRMSRTRASIPRLPWSSREADSNRRRRIARAVIVKGLRGPARANARRFASQDRSLTGKMTHPGEQAVGSAREADDGSGPANSSLVRP